MSAAVKRPATLKDLLGLQTEEQVQATIIDGFEVMGYTVWQTSRRGVVCKSCRKKTFGGDGASFGLPDLVVTHRSWLCNEAFLLEVKGPKTPLSPDQQGFVNAGRYTVARSWDEALVELRVYEMARKVRA